MNKSGRQWHEECGVFGVHQVPEAAKAVYYGLHSLQHRGQEACGIASSDGIHMLAHKGLGIVNDIFDKSDLDALPGCHALGHVRYGTQGNNIIENAQPIMVRSHQGTFGLAHNGQIVNATALRLKLEQQGSIFQGTSDTEIIAHLMQRSEGSFLEKIKQACRELEGAFSLIVMTKNTMYAVRDKYGFHPLAVGRLGEGYVFSSESCAFEIVGAKFWRDVEPGEVIKIGKNETIFDRYAPSETKACCAMEYVYFARPDSNIDGVNVHASRRQSGEIMGSRDTVEADIVIGVPDSSLSAAMGYAFARNIPYEMGLIKNKYVGRTFIQPTQAERSQGVKMKLSAVSAVVKGKRLVLVDDSIVRGTTSYHIVQLLRDAGAAEVHVRIVSAPLVYPCYYGIDLPNRNDLISAHNNTDELCAKIGADTLKFLSVTEMQTTFGSGICTGCFSGHYPTPVTE